MPDFDAINPLKNYRSWTGRLLTDRGEQVNTLARLNIGDGLELTEDLEASQSHTLTVKASEAHKAEFHNDTGASQTVSGAYVFSALRVNGEHPVYDGSVKNNTSQGYLFDTASNVISFPAQDRFYSIYVNLQIDPSFVGTPTLVVDFALSGSDLNGAQETDGTHTFMHHQSSERTLRQGVSNVLMSTGYGVYVDEHLFASGAQIYVATDGNAVGILSSSIAIVEG